MSGLVPFVPADDRSHGEQIKDALEKALNIQGTVISDLENAINCIIVMERAMQMCGVPNPHEVTAKYLKSKYNMDRKTADKSEDNSRKLLEATKTILTDGDVLALTEGKVVQSEDEIADAEIVDD